MLLQERIIIEPVFTANEGGKTQLGAFCPGEKDKSVIVLHFYVLLLSSKHGPYMLTYLIGALVAAAVAALHGVASGNPHLSPYHYSGSRSS